MKNTLTVYCTRDEAEALAAYWQNFITYGDVPLCEARAIRDVLRYGKGGPGPGLQETNLVVPENLDLGDVSHARNACIADDILVDWLLDCGGIWLYGQRGRWVGDVGEAGRDRVRESFRSMVSTETSLPLLGVWCQHSPHDLGMWMKELGAALGRHYWLERTVGGPEMLEWGSERLASLLLEGLDSLEVPAADWDWLWGWLAHYWGAIPTCLLGKS